MGVQIRPAMPSDAAALAEIDRLSLTPPWSEASFRQELAGNDKAIYLAAVLDEPDGRLIGYAGIWCILDEGDITNVAVHPDFRKKGIGFELVAKLLEAAENRGAVRQTLEVRAGNLSALRLYERFGFQSAGIRKNYYADNQEDAVIMWRASE